MASVRTKSEAIDSTEWVSSGCCVSIPSMRRTAWRSTGSRYLIIVSRSSRLVTSEQLAAATMRPCGPKMGSATDTMP